LLYRTTTVTLREEILAGI